MFSGSDRYTKFWSTLFELHLARHLTHPSVQIEVQADESRERGCDFKVVAQDGHEDIAAIEAYAPHKGIDDWHERIIAAPWRELVGSTLAERSSVRRLESPGIDPDSISRALSGMMTRPSFRAKLEQLNTVLSCGSYSRMSYILTGQCGPRDPKLPSPPSYEMGSYLNYPVLLMMSLMPQANGGPPWSICDSYSFVTR